MTDKRLGCYDVLLIHPPFHRRVGSGSVPPMGLLSLASFLTQNSFSCKVIDCALQCDSQSITSLDDMKQWLTSRLQKLTPQLLIGIGPCTTSTIRAAKSVTQTCRKLFPDVPIVCGGPLTLIPGLESVFFEHIGATVIVKGDGELALASIAENTRLGLPLTGIPGVQTAPQEEVFPTFMENIDALPFPDWSQINLSHYMPSVRRDLFSYPSAPAIGSRGCALSCGFCLSGSLQKYRRHSLEYIADHAALLTKHHGAKSIIFYDDCLFPPNRRCVKDIQKFCRLMNERSPGVVWQMEVVPTTLKHLDKNTSRLLYNSGCRQLNIGVEKSSESALKVIGKKFSVQELRDGCDLIRESAPGMRLTATFILGGPGETYKSVQETIALAQELPVLFAHFYPLLLYPGTPLYDSVIDDGGKLWLQSAISEIPAWGELVYENDELKSEELHSLVRYAYETFYGNASWIENARIELGEHFEYVDEIIKSWSKSRFRLESK